MGAGGFIEFLGSGAIIVAVGTFGMLAIVWMGEQTGIAIDQLFGVGGEWQAERRSENQATDDVISVHGPLISPETIMLHSGKFATSAGEAIDG